MKRPPTGESSLFAERTPDGSGNAGRLESSREKSKDNRATIHRKTIQLISELVKIIHRANDVCFTRNKILFLPIFRRSRSDSCDVTEKAHEIR